jgi:hypothetical protein
VVDTVRLGVVELPLLTARPLFELDCDLDTLDESVRLDRDVEDDVGRDDFLPPDFVDELLRLVAIGYLRLDSRSVCA